MTQVPCISFGSFTTDRLPCENALRNMPLFAKQFESVFVITGSRHKLYKAHRLPPVIFIRQLPLSPTLFFYFAQVVTKEPPTEKVNNPPPSSWKCSVLSVGLQMMRGSRTCSCCRPQVNSHNYSRDSCASAYKGIW